MEKLDLKTVVSVLEAFGIVVNERFAECNNINKSDGLYCEGGSGWDIAAIEGVDDKMVNLYFCEVCGKLTYQILDDK